MSLPPDRARPHLTRLSADGYPMPGVYPLRPLTFGEIFGAAFKLSWRNAWPLLPIALVATVVAQGVNIAMLAALGELHWVAVNGFTFNFQSNPTDAQMQEQLGHVGRVVAASLLSTPVSFVGTAILSASAAPLASDAALHDRSNRRELARVRRRIWPILGAAALFNLLVLAGVIALVVPGLLVSIALSVTIPAAVMEGLGPRAALRRAATLTKGFRPRILGLQLVAALISAGLGGVAGAAAAIAIIHHATVSDYIYLQILIAVLTTYISAWFATVVALLYVDLRMRREDLGRRLWAHATSTPTG